MITARFTSCWVFDVISWQAHIEAVFIVIHLYHLSSLFFFFFSHHAICRFLNKRTSLVLNYISSPGKLSCALHICLSHFQRYQLWISLCIFVLQTSQHPSPPRLLFTVISSCLRILLRTVVMFESKLRWLEGPLRAGVIQRPDGNRICRAVCWTTSPVLPIALCFGSPLCCVVWEQFWTGCNLLGFFLF